MPKPLQQFVQFGPVQIPFSQLFILTRRHVFAAVNLKPVVLGFLFVNYNGHVLVCSRRPVKISLRYDRSRNCRVLDNCPRSCQSDV
ncbi:unnamed protein product (macronuclear) [Paramecium tetraurelia]|uniref:Uncharacterized protein n=1 Tax=Paramecium tetraurelia TaxID=5888 RepID=A0BW26_PARTE|nr:uncharacterized protein GSPATT00032595001 [Paramecium tetraurelia]CAK62743.1 unnamed protein product [Paramecium tetraurelia]|eukprot:XP_001430141.1 hypothetical protein (macronuclear) [Paramecium tetraurelia strain d4-2]